MIVSQLSSCAPTTQLSRQGSVRLRRLLSRSASLHTEGSTGFEELRKHIKQGNEFCQQISNILHERSEVEMTYAKALSKLGQKIHKTTAPCIGTLSDSWSLVGVEMESEGELHKQLAQAFTEDLSKPIRNLAEQQTKSRKPIEIRVEKAQKNLTDKRLEESKCKKNCFSTAKEREKLYEQLAASRSGKGKNITDKDIGKMEKKIRSLDDSLRKMDKEYMESSEKAESCRQEWELCVYRASGELQKIEEERISQMQDFLNKYNSHMSVAGPKLIKSCDKLGEAVLAIDMGSDIRKVVDAKGTGPHQPEQILPDYFAEDTLNSMDTERRRQALQNYLIYVQQDIERELKGRDGVQKLLDVYRNKPSFADADTQEDSRQKLHQVNCMVSFLEATYYKLSCAMSDLEGRTKPTSKYQQCIERTKDKQGQATSVLRYHGAQINATQVPECSGSSYRAPADGEHVDSYAEKPHGYHGGSISLKRQSSKQTAPPVPTAPPLQQTYRESAYDAYPDDEFDPVEPAPLCHCRAIYDYTASQADELSIHVGDVITVYSKQEDGWWQGEFQGRSGIFPATYVENL